MIQRLLSCKLQQDLTAADLTESPSEKFGERAGTPTDSRTVTTTGSGSHGKIPRDTWVHMDEGSIELTGELQVKKTTNEEPTVSGTIETVRGWYAFHGRKFRIERGEVTVSRNFADRP